MKLVSPSWPFNCAWIQPSSQSSYPFRRGEGPTAECPPPWPFSTKGDPSVFLFQTISLPKHQGIPHKELQSHKGSGSSATTSKPSPLDCAASLLRLFWSSVPIAFKAYNSLGCITLDFGRDHRFGESTSREYGGGTVLFPACFSFSR